MVESSEGRRTIWFRMAHDTSSKPHSWSWSKFHSQMSIFQMVGHNMTPYLTQKRLKRWIYLPFSNKLGNDADLLPKDNLWSISEIVHEERRVSYVPRSYAPIQPETSTLPPLLRANSRPLGPKWSWNALPGRYKTQLLQVFGILSVLVKQWPVSCVLFLPCPTSSFLNSKFRLSELFL